ncbi:hypothetical protein BDW62DRAFT_186605 [Aspergillus aurantiobrunneus]
MLFSALQSLALFASGAFAFHDCPMPECSSCLSLSQYDAPGIGIGLTSAYGTSAVHLQNGTSLDLAKVEATDDFKDLFVRLSKSPPAPPSDWESFKRWLNKKLGRPATPEVGILGDFLHKLSLASHSALQACKGTLNETETDSDTVVVSAPLFPALTQEDLNDALEYTGLRSWLTLPIPYPQRLSESRAAFGANGFGLCQNYKDLYDCKDEYEELPWEIVYYVSFTRHALYTNLDRYQAAFDLGSETEHYLFDSKAGANSLTDYPSSAVFWSYVGSQLEVLPQQRRLFPTKILLAGENATNPYFLRVLRDTLGSVRLQDPRQSENSPVDLLATSSSRMADPVFAAARGAALYARWRQEAPFDCVERPECEVERRREREGNPISKTRVEL